MGWQFGLQTVWNARLKQKLQTKTTNASLKAVHQRNTQSRQLAKVEVGREREDGPQLFGPWDRRVVLGLYLFRDRQHKTAECNSAIPGEAAGIPISTPK
jgi:hypothetical protein